ncbi:type II secretion system F family protein [Amphritea japonica]|uniref:General secretion pathway protein F n=1 Tax=Amphritea japonica ATCC BAA-1530 TaxID=1278309 RepID=A0A7R6P695_9GAMM|nr:type II secretion system F family protein [Amphritea japonica]BBB26754.1 general secretion pathway protein F [Amphritea japonica ATCC BAA-1530]
MMTTFFYKAISNNGELTEGSITAESREDVISQLQSSGKVPIYADSQQPKSLKKRSKASGIGSANTELILEFTQELMYLVEAGIPLDRSLEILGQDNPSTALQELISELRQQLRGGQTFSQALEKFPRYFNPLYISLIRASEAGGEIARGLETLCQHLERNQQLKEKVSAALLYPAILLGVSLLSILMILLYVVPQFADIIAGFSQELPPETRFVLWLSQITIDYGVYFLGGLLALIALLYRTLASGATATWWDTLRLALPMIGPLHIKLEYTRFCRSLGNLINSGVPMLTSIDMASAAFSNGTLNSEVTQAAIHLREGGRLSDQLRNSNQVPSLVVQLTQVGEETGELPSMLLKIADIYDRQIETQTQKLLHILEPVLILSLGLIIAVLILSLLSAIIGINDIAL